MEESLSIFIIATLSAGLVAATPVLLAALGEILSERSGVLNLGQEGLMLVGAVTSFLVTVNTSSKWWGLLAGVFICILLGLVHAFLTITLKSNQIVSGLAMVLFGTGLSSVLGKSVVGIPTPDRFSKLEIPGLYDVPFIGKILFSQNLITYFAILLVPLIWFIMYKTRIGLHLRAVGESPETADGLGVNVQVIRYVSVMIGASLTGVAGAFFSLAYVPSWIEGVSAGRGWLAIAVVVFSTWDPVRAFIGAFLYGIVFALGYRFQVIGLNVPSEFINMLPYIFPIIIVVLVSWRYRDRSVSPRALGIPYDRESA